MRPLLFRLDAETAHRVAMRALRICDGSPVLLELVRAAIGTHPGESARTVFGVRFPNPVGLAAGFDKDGLALAAWAALGFGFVEAGTLTPVAQPGNPAPRLFRRAEQRALINRLGFNNAGAEAAAARFASLRQANRWPRIPVGINIGKNKATPIERAAEDYVKALEMLHEYGDYFVLNVSSPNTPQLRALQGRDDLAGLLHAVSEKNRALPVPRPILLKIAPDLSFEQIEAILTLATEYALAGIVATNTTTDHSSLPATGRGEAGGLSGEPLRRRSTAIVRFLAERTALPIIAAGGVSDGASAREKLDAGAALVQIYTGFVYGGPTLIREICAEL